MTRRERFAKTVVTLALISLLPSTAWAYCSEPSVPDVPSTYNRPSKPSAPYCVDTFSNTHTCDDWEIDNYNSELSRYRDEVEEYIRKLRYYVSKAETYYSEAVSYAQCEANNIE